MVASQDINESVSRPISIKHVVYALSILVFFVLHAFSSLADKFLFALIAICVFVKVIGKLRLNKIEVKLIVWSLTYFGVAIVCAFLFSDYFGLHSYTGLYELWRGQISLLLGLILSSYIGTKQKDDFVSGLMLALKLNVIFSLLQVISGGYLVEVMLVFSQFEGEVVEFRSGIARAVGFFTNPNTNAWFLALFLFNLMAQIKLNRFWMVLTSIALLSTGSRTVIFMSVLILGFQFLFRNGAQIFKIMKKHALLILFVVVTFISLESFKENSSAVGYSFIPDLEVITNVNEGAVGDSYFRAYALMTSLQRFLDSPVVGLGPGNYGTPSSFRTHSTYLYEDGYEFFIDRGMTQLDLLIPLLLPETGMLGLIFWVAIMAVILKEIKKRELNKTSSQVVYLWCLLLIANAFVGPGITHPLVVAMLPILVACFCCRQNSDKYL